MNLTKIMENGVAVTTALRGFPVHRHSEDGELLVIFEFEDGGGEALTPEELSEFREVWVWSGKAPEAMIRWNGTEWAGMN